MTQYVLYDTEQDGGGEITVHTTDGQTIRDQARVLNLHVLNTETNEAEAISLIVPRQSGPALLLALLTEDQWEALQDA